MADIAIFILIGTNKLITVKIDFWLLTISTRLQDFTFFGHPDGRHFLDWFFNLAIDMGSVTVFVLISTNEFITVKVFFWLFTVSTRFQHFTFFSDPNGRHFLNRTINVSDITVFVLVSTNEFITVKVFLRMFTVSTRFQNLAFFSDPDSSYFLDRFFDRAIDMCGITILVLIRANKFITVKVFLWMFTVSTRFQNLTFFGDPNSGHFLDWFFNWTIDMSSVTIFVFIRTNEFVTVEVFFWLLTIGSRFQNLAFFSHPNGGHLLDWFFNRFVDMGRH